ncbi:MAG: PD40 domain-containing protein, partial [Acidobacteria bacterium]|nr:PD40 domain-containing protein [Acidobacteriota bacterium]
MTTSPDGVRSQLEKILASPRFVHSERLKRFLRYVVEEGLAGRGENLKEYTLALAVFDKDESHDTSQDPIVRVEARRLRARLKEYYETDGRKDPLRIELPKGSYAPAFLPAAPPSRKTRWRAPAIASTALMAAIGIASFYGFREKPVVPREWVLKRLTADSGLTTHPAISRDGTRVAFASDRGGENNLEIWVQPSAGGDPLRLTHHPSDDYEPAFSPDATRIAFRSDRLGGGIYVVPALGGEVRAVAPYGRNPRFSPDGKWIAYWVGSLGGDLLSPAGRVFIVPANGGAAQPIQPEFPSAVYPVWSPDGRYLLFLGTLDTDTAPERRFDWWTAPVASGRPEKAGLGDLLQRQGLAMLPNGGPPEWTADALLFTARGGDSTNLWQVRFSSSRRRVVGPAARITFGTALEMYPSAALDGRIAFASVTHNSDLWSQPVEPHEGVVAGEMQRLTEGPANEIFPSVSADGNRLAFLSDRSGSLDVWLKDLRSGVETSVAAGGLPKRYPRISPSGSRIVYSEQAGGRSASYLVSAAGGDRETLCEGCSRAWGWS